MKKPVQYILALLMLLAASTAEAQRADSNNARQRAVDYYYMEAAALLEQGEIDGCFELLQHCHALDSGSSAVQYLLAPFYSALGKDSTALEMLQYIVKENPDNETYCKELVDHYHRIGDTQSAIAVYEGIVDKAHSKSDIYKALYALYYEDGNHEKALEALNAISRLEGTSMELMAMKVQQYLFLGRNDEAISIVKQIIDENPDDPRFENLLGEVYNIIGEEQLAEKTFLCVLNKTPDDAMAQTALVEIYSRTGDVEGYNSIAGDLIKNEKVDTEERLQNLTRYILYKEATDSASVIPLMKEIIGLPFDRLEHYELFADYLEYKKAGAGEIVPILEKIVELDPENVATIVKLLTYAIDSEDIEAVLKYANEALLYIPDRIEFYYYKGLSLYLLDDKKQSLEAYIQGVENINDNSTPDAVSAVYAAMGDLYHELDMRKESYAAYDSAMVYDPYNINVLNNYAYYLSLEGKELQKALEMSHKTIIAEPEEQTYLDTYAWILFKLERYEEAKAYAEKIISLSDDEEAMSAVVLHHIGDIFAKCGNIDKAVIYWEKARAAGDNTKILNKKIKKKRYYRGAKD